MIRVLLCALALAAQPVFAQTRVVGDLPHKPDQPLEETPGLETEYGVVRTSEGLRLRTILTRPLGRTRPLPALFVTQWVSCGSIAFRPGRDSEVGQLALRSGLAMIRVERSGDGDSEGPGCAKLDYDTEVRHYREALDQVVRHPWIDGRRIVIFGSSLGATTAPLVAQNKPVAGILVQGGGALTYLERMIAFDRLQLERSGSVPPENIHAEMHRRIAFQQLYLLDKRTPQQVAAERPELAGVWESLLGTTPDAHYGRPFAWHWQAAEKNFLAAWLRVLAPVMVVYAGFDNFEMEHGHRLIAELRNRQRSGSTEYLMIPNAGHDLELYPDPFSAYQWKDGAKRYELFLEPAIKWMRRIVGFSDQTPESRSR
jgi:predicted acyl esterase